MLRVAMNPRDDLAGIVNVGRPDGVVRNKRAVFGKDIHHCCLIVLHAVGDEVLQTVGHPAILWVWSNAIIAAHRFGNVAHQFSGLLTS